jgi:hypothetical protein
MQNDHFQPDLKQNVIQNLRLYENYLVALVKKYPTKSLPKPKLPNNHTHEELEVYKEKFAAYTRSQNATEKSEAKYEELSSEAEQILFEFLKNKVDFYNKVPVQYQDRTWSKANQEKELYDKYVELSELCNIFVPE